MKKRFLILAIMTILIIFIRALSRDRKLRNRAAELNASDRVEGDGRRRSGGGDVELEEYER